MKALRPLCFLDFETTGTRDGFHEIIEIGAVRVDPSTWEEIEIVDVRVAPLNIADADPVALQVNGYSPELWHDAVSLRRGLGLLSPLLYDATIAGANVGFDLRFLRDGMQRTGLPMPPGDYHSLDVSSLAFAMRHDGIVDSVSLDSLCRHFGIPRATPHRALADCRAAAEVTRRIVERSFLADGPRANVLVDVLLEQERQDAKWGQQNHPNGTGLEHEWDTLPNALCPRRAKRRCEAAAERGELTYAKILVEEVAEALEEDNPATLRDELVQAAAVSCSWIEKIDRDAARYPRPLDPPPRKDDDA